MAWTSGFFNSVDGDRVYNAQQMSEIFQGLITEGVYESVGDQLVVKPNDGMTIQISTGRGWIGAHWVHNDSPYTYTLENSDVLLDRYCAVCIRADDSDAVRSAVPYFKYSDFATNPTKPAMERTEKVTERCLAYIYIKAGAKKITAADIEDTRGDVELCGWVSGLIEQVDTTTLWNQYKAEWGAFLMATEAEIEPLIEETDAAKDRANAAAGNAQSQADYAQSSARVAAGAAESAYTAAKLALDAANGNIMLFDPSDGQYEPLQTILNHMQEEITQLAGHPITAAEFDALGTTATAYDALSLTAANYDVNAKTLLG